MAEQNLDAARELISEERYDQARAILQMSTSREARALLRRINRLERGGQRISPFRPPYLFMLLLGIALPLLLAYGLITNYSGGEGFNLPIAAPVQAVTVTRSASATATRSATATQTASRTATPSPTATRTFTPSATRNLPSTWTPTTPPPVVTIDTSATALARAVATGKALVSASQTAAANQPPAATENSQTLGVVGTPDNACQNAARLWWRNARLVAADTLFDMIGQQNTNIQLILDQPEAHSDLRSGLGDQVTFMQSLYNQLTEVEFPACAGTARNLVLDYVRFRILVAQNIAASDQTRYESNIEEARVRLEYFYRELDILSVPHS